MKFSCFSYWKTGFSGHIRIIFYLHRIFIPNIIPCRMWKDIFHASISRFVVLKKYADYKLCIMNMILYLHCTEYQKTQFELYQIISHSEIISYRIICECDIIWYNSVCIIQNFTQCLIFHFLWALAINIFWYFDLRNRKGLKMQ